MTETELYELLEGLRNELNGLRLDGDWPNVLLAVRLDHGKWAVLDAARAIVGDPPKGTEDD